MVPREDDAPDTVSAGEAAGGEPDFASFDHLVESLAAWSGALPGWAPARRVRGEQRRG